MAKRKNSKKLVMKTKVPRNVAKDSGAVVKANSKAVSGNKRTKTGQGSGVEQPFQSNAFPIVGIGASAGGLEAFTQLFSALPVDTGMAFVVVQHLDPAHQSLAPEILSRTTQMPVHEVQSGMRALPNNIYVIPSNFSMTIFHGILSLLPRTEARGQHLVIDSFFQSLATDQRGRAIGVVLSGTATDGTIGLKSIKAEGGIAIVQDPESAKHDGMPKSAIASGVVDLILPPEAIALELSRISHHPYIMAACEAKTVSQEEDVDTPPDAALRKIFMLLRTRTHIDFSNYKHTTLKRRLERRMMVRKSENVDAYAKYLGDHPDEIKALYADFLINVTEFFRDPESFKALTNQVFPSLMKDRAAGAPIRVWVPGCSTGEEVYSLAILLLEFLGDKGAKTPIQVFATDISEQALKKARAGIYSEGIERIVSKDRLRLYFEKVEGGYKINKTIRSLCLFSRHDVTSDPPFAKLDLVSCRNLLIYFAADLQNRVIPIFHYALKSGGFLWLGRSESPGAHSKLFAVADKLHKIYSKINVPTPMSFRFPRSSYVPEISELSQKARARGLDNSDFQKDPDHIALARYAPPGVLVNADLEILQFRGRTAPYLEPAPGFASNLLLKMARPELRNGLRMAAHLASKKNKTARQEGLSFEVDGRRREVNVEVIPANPQAPIKLRNFMIFFEEVSFPLSKQTKKVLGRKPSLKKGKAKKTLEEHRQETQHLELELTASQQYQQTMTEEFETTKEELTSANEELQSTNEELQSSNEELETAKEELQSSNEELSTVNDELQNRNTELAILGSDLNNLFISSEIPIILIIGGDRRIRRFTPKAEKYFKLTPNDVGRPISDIKSDFDLDLDAMISEVVHSLTPQEREIQGYSGRWLRVNVRPYKTLDNRIDGAVIVLVDIHDLKQRLEISDVALKYSMSVAETVQLPFAVLDHDLRLMSANTSFFDYFEISQENNEGAKLFDILGIRHGRSAGLLTALNQTLTSKIESQKFEIDFESPNLGIRKLQVSAKKIQWIGLENVAILVALEDITERKRVEGELAHLMVREQEARAEAESGNRAKDVFLATLSHELRTPLSSILTWAQLIRMGKIDFEKAKQGAAVIEQSAKNQAQLIDDLLDVSRAIMGKLHLEKKEVDPADVIREAHDTVRPLAEKKNIQIETTFSSDTGMVLADSVRLQQIVWNLLTNAIKFSSKDSSIELRLEYIGDQAKRFARIKVTDHGRGIGSDFLPHVFDRFSQAESASTRAHGGLGLGLSIVRKLVDLHGGTVHAESAGENKGTTFTVTLPVLTSKDTLNDNLKTTLKTQSDSTLQNEPLKQVESETQETDLNGLRVLFVDDDESTREAISEFLKSSGADVMNAESASEALKVLQTFKPHILLSDIAMPGEDGYSLIRKIRALTREHGGDVPALALTANATSQDVQQALKAGFQSHMSKPVESQSLARAILKLAVQQQ